MVHFCPSCNKVMIPDTNTGNLKYKCPSCYQEELANNDDHILISRVFKNEFTYNAFISGASLDPTNNKILEDCPECKLPYLTKLRIGNEEKLVKTCKCGYSVILN